MVAVHERVQFPVLLDAHDELAFLVDRVQFGGRAEVTLAEGRVLQELANAVEVALRRPELRRRFDDQQAWLHIPIKHPAMGECAWDVHVVALAEIHGAERRLQPSLAVVDKHKLVAPGVLVELVLTHCLRRHAEREIHVGVAHDVPAPRQPATPRRYFLAEKMAVLEEVSVHVLHRIRLRLQHLVYQRRRVDVVGDGRDSRKALRADYLLGVERTVGPRKLGVPLGRDGAELLVVGHSWID